MAYIMPSQLSTLPVIYNLDSTVGPNVANEQDDVMLVQYLLQVCNFPIIAGGLPTSGTSTIKVDGFYGQETQRCIDAFQNQMTADKKVFIRDPFLESSSDDGFTQSGFIYKIVLLNIYASNRMGGSFTALATFVPPLLRNSLMGSDDPAAAAGSAAGAF